VGENRKAYTQHKYQKFEKEAPETVSRKEVFNSIKDIIFTKTTLLFMFLLVASKLDFLLFQVRQGLLKMP
jgi:hypothetical protein